MNVLLVLPTPISKCEGYYIWKSKLSPQDHIFIMSIHGAKVKETCDYDIHQLDIDFEKSRYWRRMLFRILRNLPSKFWTLIIQQFWSDFLWNVRSFDPDIIDLRWMPCSQILKSKLIAEMKTTQVLSDEDISSIEYVDTSWRCYEPDMKVSIVLPVYNGERYLSQSIESCLQQTHRNLELVIVDDCSTDKTPDIIARYAQNNPKIISIHNNHNLRLPGALNVGFAKTTGELLTWTSHDNYYAPNAIETLVRYLCTYKYIDFVYSAYNIIDEIGKVSSEVNYLPPPWELPFQNTVGAYFLYRRTVYDEVGAFREDMEYLEDYEYWVRVYKKGFKMMRLHLPFYYYRHHFDSMTTRARNIDDKLWDKVQNVHFRHKKLCNNLFRRGI